jgi:hypothetical protein
MDLLSLASLFEQAGRAAITTTAIKALFVANPIEDSQLALVQADCRHGNGC